jgi:cation transport regulator ChaB
MPYSKSSPPKAVKSLPAGARAIFVSAFNAAVKEYGEERAFKIAWAAVKRKYKKVGEKWVAKAGDELVTDAIQFDEPLKLTDKEAKMRVTSDGYLLAAPRIARTGIQIYKGWEVGDDREVIRVYRPEDEVFHIDALKSLAWKPITNSHPGENINAENWHKFAVGQISGDVARDGDFIRVPLMLMDAAAIAAVRGGKAELSVGYSAELKWGEGTSPAGEIYDAMQTGIRANHVAIVDAARGGPLLRIGDDEEVGDEDEDTDRQQRRLAMSGETNSRMIVVDGVSIEVPEISAQVVQRALQKLEDDMVKLKEQTKQQVAEATRILNETRAIVDTKEGEVIALKRELAEKELTPQKRDQMVRERLEIVQKASAILGDKYSCDGKTDIEIKRAVIAARHGEQLMRALNDEAITGAFMIMTADSSGADGVRTLAHSLSSPDRRPHSAQDAAAIAYEERNKYLQNAWRRQPDSETKQ